MAGLTNLTELRLEDNSISDISAVAGLTNLTELTLNNNSISNISPLVANTGLGRWDWVDVSENPLNAAAIHIRIPTLQDRGVEIRFDNIVVQPGDIDQTVVEISDPNLRAAIENALGKASGDTITAADMATLTQLFARNANISDLTGLEAATNLITLSLGDNNITDISPVTGLTNLTFLWLEGNNITDISPLAGLTNLTVLGLWENSISDISPLAGLTILTELGLWENSILNLLPLVANTGLGNGDRVNVKGNSLSITSINTHISALKNRGVEVQFDGSVVQPEDIAQMVDMPDPNLRTAVEAALGKASGATITVADMLTLTELSPANDSISDLTGLEAATNLTQLTLWSDSISDISALARLTNLTELVLVGNNISDISALAELTNLTRLVLFYNSISDISALAGLTNLTGLMLQNNSITDISALAGLTNLTGLVLQNNSITDISALAGLTNLTGLVLQNNSITDISALAGLTNLPELRLQNNNITDISALAGLTNLTRLWLDNNNISDLSPLVANTGLGSGDRVDVRGNFLNAAAIDTHIPELQNRGVAIQFDEIIVEPGDIAQTVDIPDPQSPRCDRERSR